MEMQIQEVAQRDVLKIQVLVGEHDYKVEKGTAMFGQKYKRFSYLGKAFIMNSADPFESLLKAGQLHSVSFGLNEDGQLSCVGYTTHEQETNMAKAVGTINKIITASKIPNLTEEQLQALENEI